MFFVRAAFWIFLILLLLPTNDREKSDFYTAAGRTISDLGDFCTRNPDVCDKTGAIFSTFLRKIQEAVHSLDNAIAGEGDTNARHDRDRHPGYTIRERTPDPRARSRVPGQAYIAPAVDGSQNTLRQDDLAPAWRGPAGSGLRHVSAPGGSL
jgi:hypothetical protein